MTIYSGWSHSEYISGRKNKHVERWELDAWKDDEDFSFDSVVKDITEQVGDTSELRITGIEVKREREATQKQIEEKNARDAERHRAHSEGMVRVLKERHGDDPSQWPGMS